MPLLDKRGFYSYEIALARALSRVEGRGILVDQGRLQALRKELQCEIAFEVKEISDEIRMPVVLSKAEAKSKGDIILQSSKQVLTLLESLGIPLRINRLSGKPSSESSSLHIALAETGSTVVHSILQLRELGKIKSVYVEAPLFEDTLYGSLKVTGTDTGRRSSSANPFGFGTNLQNLPKWSAWAKRYRSCLVSRPGKIFIQADQKSAEDWVVNAIIADVSGDEYGINELRSGANRHIKLASFIFGLPQASISKDSIQYYLAKRVRYAGSYGMWKFTMAETLASEGKIVHPDECGNLLERFHLAEPNIRGVFQTWIESELRAKRELSTPLGRNRMFFGLRPFTNNAEVFRKGYAFIPQSTVGDNTGMAIVFLEDNAEILLSESHDSILAEVDDNEVAIAHAADLITKSFDRKLHFPVNGFEVTIPLSFELGYSLGEMIECPGSAGTGLLNTYRGFVQRQRRTAATIFGVPQQL